jgi:hypothetical protein
MGNGRVVPFASGTTACHSATAASRLLLAARERMLGVQCACLQLINGIVLFQSVDSTVRTALLRAMRPAFYVRELGSLSCLHN